jgi:hypothetical protein
VAAEGAEGKGNESVLCEGSPRIRTTTKLPFRVLQKGSNQARLLPFYHFKEVNLGKNHYKS